MNFVSSWQNAFLGWMIDYAWGARSRIMGNLIIVIGPPAVGKMTVGRALGDRIGYPLFHNHVSIEVALKFFEFGTDGFRHISESIRSAIFDAVADSELSGLIFTFAWAFNEEDDRRYVERLITRWQEKSTGQIYVLELSASDAAKRERNRHPDRLAEKPSKRDIGRSEELRRTHEHKYQFNSDGDFPLSLPHLIIDNTTLPASDVVDRFLKVFELC
jgi:hypothetical protein